MELPHHHEENNLHDFQSDLRSLIHKEVAMKNPYKTLHEAIQVTLRAETTKTKIDTTQRSTGRLNAMEEDSDVAEAAEEVDNESKEDSHGATDEKPREMYEIRRSTQEEDDIFKKEGKCFICHKRGHIAIDCPDKKNEKNEKKTMAGKVRLESAASGKLKDENSSPTKIQRHMHNVRCLKGAFKAAEYRIMFKQMRKPDMPPSVVDTCEQLNGVSTTNYLTPYGPTPSIDIDRNILHGDIFFPFLFTPFLEPFLCLSSIEATDRVPLGQTPTPPNPRKRTYPGDGLADDLSTATDSSTKFEIVYNMCRQTGPTAVSRATLLRHT
jgi:hypothetical protein